jgi:hypothetical protein
MVAPLTIQNDNTFVITDHVFAEPIFWWNLASSTNNKEMRTHSTNIWISLIFFMFAAPIHWYEMVCCTNVKYWYVIRGSEMLAAH